MEVDHNMEISKMEKLIKAFHNLKKIILNCILFFKNNYIMLKANKKHHNMY